MSCAEYYVSKGTSDWKIRVGNSEFNYSSRATALRAAIAAAVTSSANGYDAVVLTEDDDGDWRFEWKYTRTAGMPDAT